MNSLLLSFLIGGIASLALLRKDDNVKLLLKRFVIGAITSLAICSLFFVDVSIKYVVLISIAVGVLVGYTPIKK